MTYVVGGGTVKRLTRRYVAEGRPKDPNSLDLLKIENDWELTKDGERFLLYDNGPDSDNRIMIFATDMCLQLLSGAQTWFMDGTAPLLFKQIYIIRANLASSAVSCVYVFLQRKDQDTDNELFAELTTRAEQMGHYLDPDSIVTDFELAVANTIKIVIGPHVNTKFCFFHLTQNTWKKVQKLGLMVLYRSNDEVRHFIGMLDGTAFLDLGHICSGSFEKQFAWRT